MHRLLEEINKRIYIHISESWFYTCRCHYINYLSSFFVEFFLRNSLSGKVIKYKIKFMLIDSYWIRIVRGFERIAKWFDLFSLEVVVRQWWPLVIEYADINVHTTCKFQLYTTYLTDLSLYLSEKKWNEFK